MRYFPLKKCRQTKIITKTKENIKVFIFLYTYFWASGSWKVFPLDIKNLFENNWYLGLFGDCLNTSWSVFFFILWPCVCLCVCLFLFFLYRNLFLSVCLSLSVGVSLCVRAYRFLCVFWHKLLHVKKSPAIDDDDDTEYAFDMRHIQTHMYW